MTTTATAAGIRCSGSGTRRGSRFSGSEAGTCPSGSCCSNVTVSPLSRHLNSLAQAPEVRQSAQVRLLSFGHPEWRLEPPTAFGGGVQLSGGVSRHRVGQFSDHAVRSSVWSTSWVVRVMAPSWAMVCSERQRHSAAAHTPVGFDQSRPVNPGVVRGVSEPGGDRPCVRRSGVLSAMRPACGFGFLRHYSPAPNSVLDSGTWTLL